MIGILISLGDGLCQPLSYAHIISEFWNRVKHFLKLFWTFFCCPWFSFTDSDAQFCFSLFFVSSPSWEQGQYTRVLHLSQALFWKICEKSFKKILVHSFSIKKSRTFFVLPFQYVWDIKRNYRCQGQRIHHF